MPAKEDRLERELKKFLGMREIGRRIDALESKIFKMKEEQEEAAKEIIRLSRKIERLETETAGGRKVKMADIIEEKTRDLKSPFRVVEVREMLRNDERVNSSAGNFYSVIATAMNNSSKFRKVASGTYEYVANKGNT